MIEISPGNDVCRHEKRCTAAINTKRIEKWSEMKKNLLMWDETLFRDPEVFEFDYVPEQFQFRENQMRELAFQNGRASCRERE
jgi:hypothetical protein